MCLKIEQTTEFQPKRTPRDSTRKDGVPLGELLEFLTTAQAHGIPDGACVQITNGWGDYKNKVVVHWTEER
jgi:hypothetical protein